MKKGIAVVLLATLIDLLCWTGASAQISFAPYVAQATGSHFEFIVSADIDGDTDQDLVGATTYYFDPANDYKLFVWVNNMGVLAPPVKFAYDGSYNQRTNAIAANDINGDGNQEVILACGDSVKVFDWQSNTMIKTFSRYTGQLADGVDVGDVDSDGFYDIVVSHWNSPWITVLYGSGSLTTFLANTNYTMPNAGWDQILVAKLGHDTTNSIIYMRGQTFLNNIEIVTINTNRTTNVYVPLNLTNNELPNGIAVGDVNNNGSNELVMTYGGNVPSSAIAIWDTFITSAIYQSIPTSDIPQPVRIADLDCEFGSNQIIVAHGGWLHVSVNKDTASALSFPIPYASQYQPTGMTVGDWNNDGRLDVALADYNYGLVLLYNNTIPTFTTIVGSDTITIGTAQYSDTISVIVTSDTIANFIVTTTTSDTCMYLVTDYQVEDDTVTVECGDTIVTIGITFYSDTLTFCGTVVTMDTIFTVDTYSVIVPRIIAFPNPTQGKVKVNDLANASITVTNVLGQAVSPPINGNEVDFGGFPSGIYLISIHTPSGGWVATLKVVKQ